MSADDIIDLYDRNADAYDRDRGRSLQERAWLDRFLAGVAPGGTVLDIGCGVGEPIARYIMDAGYDVVGIDSSPALIARCRERFPDSEWIVADMRRLELGRSFDGLIAWDSFFHLGPEDQRGMFPRFARHARSGAPLMFTSGSAAGVAIGSWCGEPLYHASLSPAEYERLLRAHGFVVDAYVEDDAECGNHTVWLARHVAGATYDLDDGWVRVATPDDIETLFDIRTSVVENHQSREELASIGVTPATIHEMLQTSSRAWIGFEASQPVAFSMANADEATIFAMFVRPGHENRGHGRRLMQAAEEWLFSRGCPEIWLLTGADPALRADGFYRHLGWQAAGIQADGQMKFTKRRA